MTRSMLIAILMLSFAFFAKTASAQDLPPSLSAEDVKLVRKIIADRDYEKARADEAIRQLEGWKQSAANWQKLFEAEKDRADRVQGGRIDELLKANGAYKDQAENDRQRLGELEFKLRKAKSERKWWAAIGFGTGLGAGLYGGSKINF